MNQQWIRSRLQSIGVVAALLAVNFFTTLWLQGMSISSAWASVLGQDAPQTIEAAAVAAPTTPSHLNFQGVARNAEGKRLTGAYDITFAIYDSPVAVTEKWQETQTGVTVRDGNFSVLLGTATALPPGLFNNPDRFVGITVAGFAELQPRQRFASVPYAMHAADGVPIGAVIDWWRADASVSVPDGYLICNGQTVNDAQSPLNGKVLPDLTDKFVRGVTDPTYSGFGNVGGSDSHDHDITHDHPAITVNTTENGEHRHSWGYFDGANFSTFTRDGQFVVATSWGMA